MSMEHWWNDTDKRELEYAEKNLSKCHFVRHKTQTNWPMVEHKPPASVSISSHCSRPEEKENKFNGLQCLHHVGNKQCVPYLTSFENFTDADRTANDVNKKKKNRNNLRTIYINIVSFVCYTIR